VNLRLLAVMLMALVAFVSQSFVTQTHLHFDGSARSLEFVGRTSGAADLRADHHTPAPPISCAICQEIAHSGAYLVPPDDVLQAPVNRAGSAGGVGL
jgi:hypothetical protein